MEQRYLPLFQPVQIGKVQIKNRFAMSPMAYAQLSEDYAYEDRTVDYFVERAKGGIGLIISGANFVDNTIEKHARAGFPCVTVNPTQYKNQLRKITDRTHAYGAKFFLQLNAGLGRGAVPHLVLDNTFIAPSETYNRWDPSIKCRALTTEEVYKIIDQCAASAQIAQQAGADGVEIHAVHEGYLMDHFTMKYFNRRDDEFGGDEEGRLRFPIMVLRAIKKACGEDFPVILRFSLKSFIREERKGILPGDEGKHPELGRDVEEGLRFAKLLTEAGYDALDVDGGSHDAWYWAHPPFFFKPGIYLDFAKQVKAVIDKPVLAAGRLGDPELALDAVLSGSVDVVSLGRPSLADPDFVNKLLRGQPEDIRPCLSCHDGCFVRHFNNNQLQSCAVNPQCNREREAAFGKAEQRKNAVVIGAGPAGMEAGRVLALRGHHVEIYEKQSHAGGLYRHAVVPEFKAEGKRLIKWYEHTLTKLGVPVTYEYEMRPDDAKLRQADVVICATGGKAVIPPLPGIDKAITAEELLAGRQVKSGAVIVGAGQVGCELAIWLGRKGIQTKLVDLEQAPLTLNAPAPMNKQMILELLEQLDVELVMGSRLQEVKDGSVVLLRDGAICEIQTEDVILALGYRPDASLYSSLLQQGLEVYPLGDSDRPRDIMAGIWNAYELCSHL